MAAVHLSFLTKENQRKILISFEAGRKISVSDAKKMKEAGISSKDTRFFGKNDDCHEESTGNIPDIKKVTIEFTLEQWSKFFNGEHKAKKIIEVIFEALELLNNHQK